VSEPKAAAARVEVVVPGVWHWAVRDDRIGGFVSSAHAVEADGGAVLIDPLPLAADALAGLGGVAAVVLTCGSHQRSSWRLRRELGVPVYAPAAVRAVDEEPDVRYEDGAELPAVLRAVFAPGPGTTQHVLLRRGEPSVLFCADHFVLPPDGELAFVPDEFVHDPAGVRSTARRLLDLDFEVLCLGHGARAITEHPKQAIAALLERA
jgi:glyoxylase-like metal-dependent hydrolase (beta-lactamase superfamily II)